MHADKKAFAWVFAIVLVVSMLITPAMSAANVARAANNYYSYSVGAFLPSASLLFWTGQGTIAGYNPGYYYAVGVGNTLYIYNTTGTYPNLQITSVLKSYTISFNNNVGAILAVVPYNSTSLEIISANSLGTGGALFFNSGSVKQTSFSEIKVTGTYQSTSSGSYSTSLNVIQVAVYNLATNTYQSLPNGVSVSYTVSYGTFTVNEYFTTWTPFVSLGGWNMTLTYTAPTAAIGFYTGSSSGIAVITQTNVYSGGGLSSSTLNWVIAGYSGTPQGIFAVEEGAGSVYTVFWSTSGSGVVSTKSWTVPSVIDTSGIPFNMQLWSSNSKLQWGVNVFGTQGWYYAYNSTGSVGTKQYLNFGSNVPLYPVNVYVYGPLFTFYWAPNTATAQTIYSVQYLNTNGTLYPVQSTTTPIAFTPGYAWFNPPGLFILNPNTNTLYMFGVYSAPPPPTVGQLTSSGSFPNTTQSVIPPSPPTNVTTTSPTATTYFISSSVGIMILTMLIFLPAIVLAIYLGKTGFLAGLTLMTVLLTAVGFLPVWVDVMLGLVLILLIWRPIGSGSGGSEEGD
jgi:hypothetical protein